MRSRRVLKLGMISAAFLSALSTKGGSDYGEPAFAVRDAVVVYEAGLLKKEKRVWGTSALADLTNVLSRTTLSSIAAYPENAAPADACPVIYLGDTAAARAAGLDTASMAADEFRMKIEPDRAFLAGRTGAGSSFAVTEFLKRFADYRFLTATGDDPYTVDASRIARICDIRGKCAFPSIYNGTHGVGGRYPETMGERYQWTRRLRGGFRVAEHGARYKVSWLPGRCHSQFSYCPPKKYAKDHPEYYTMDENGKRREPSGDCGVQLCFSNSDVYRICRDSLFRFVEEEVKKDPVNYPRIFDFSQQDNSGYLCKCPECRKLIARYDRKGGFADGGDAGLQLQFVNRLAREIRAKYPEVMIRTFAYCSTWEPPRDIVPEDNVIIWLCDLYSICDHQLPLTHPFNRRSHDLIKSWTALAKHVELWDYVLWMSTATGGSTDCLQVFPEATLGDARFLRDCGIESIYIENHFDNQPLWEFNTYLQLELYWDPDQDVDELIDAYCKVYGKGAREMRELIEFLRRIVRENPPASPSDWHNRILPWRTAENFERILAYARRAYAAADTLPGRRRIAAVVAGALQELVLQYRYRPEMAPRLAEVIGDYPAFAAEALETGWVKGKSLENEKRKNAGFIELATLSFKDLPPALKDVPRKDLLYFAHQTVACASRGKIVDDPQSECGKAMRWNAALMRPGAKPPFGGWVQSNGEKSVGFEYTPSSDGKYSWVNLGKYHLGANGKVCFNYSYYWNVSSAFVISDGAKEDPNWFEIWLSVRLTGAADSKEMNEGLFCDRLLLRRLPRNEQP